VPSRRAREIRRPVDVAQDSGVVDVAERQRIRVTSEQIARPFVAAQRGQLGEKSPREPDWVSALAAIRRSGDRGAFRKRIRDRADRLRLKKGHVGERDHPAVRCGGGAHAGGKAPPHPFGGVLADEDIAARLAKQLRELRGPRPDDRNRIGQDLDEMLRRGEADRRPGVGRSGRKRLEELVGAEALRVTRGEEDAADGHRGADRPLVSPG